MLSDRAAVKVPTMKLLNRVTQVEWLGGHRLRLVFRDGYTGEVDLAPIAAAPRGPLEEPLRDVEFFRQVRCDGYTATWPNEYDICPDVLRYWCELGRVCSQEELNAAFNQQPVETSASVLNDKPSA